MCCSQDRAVTRHGGYDDDTRIGPRLVLRGHSRTG